MEYAKKKTTEYRDRDTDAETSNRKPDDTLLRKHGFQIKSRPKTGINIWCREGKDYEESLALDLVRRGTFKEIKVEQAKQAKPESESAS